MIKVDMGNLEMRGDLDILSAETTIVAREFYRALCEKLGEEIAEYWLNGLADDIRITDEELENAFYERMIGE